MNLLPVIEISVALVAGYIAESCLLCGIRFCLLPIFQGRKTTTVIMLDIVIFRTNNSFYETVLIFFQIVTGFISRAS